MVSKKPSAVFADATRPAQRFQWKMNCGDDWLNGVVARKNHAAQFWTIVAGETSASFDDDPWEAMGQVIGDAAAFRWVDNDHGWEPI